MKYFACYPLDKNIPVFSEPPILLRTSSDNADIELPREYQNITREEFECFSKNGIRIGSPFQEIDLSFASSPGERKIYHYVYYYSKFVHTLINKCNLTWEWQSILSWKENESITESLDRILTDINQIESNSNPFFLNMQQDCTSLAKDIIDNGLYFPFYYELLFSGEKRLYLGKHRLYSLLQNKNYSNEFLFINVKPLSPEKMTPEVIFQEKYRLSEKIPCYYLSKDPGRIFVTEEDYLYFIRQSFIKISDRIAPSIAKYRNCILPNPIFNDERMFKDFISKPFPIIDRFEKIII